MPPENGRQKLRKLFFHVLGCCTNNCRTCGHKEVPGECHGIEVQTNRPGFVLQPGSLVVDRSDDLLFVVDHPSIGQVFSHIVFPKWQEGMSLWGADLAAEAQQKTGVHG